MRVLFSPLLVIVILLPGATSAKDIPVPGPPLVTVTLEGSPGTLMVTPARMGPTLADLGMVIHVVIHDQFDEPIAGFPFQDVWLNDVGDASLSVCPRGSSADGNTDIDGHTTISGSMAAGGYTETGLLVYIAGIPITDQVLAISVNSPDMNADLAVNIADVAELAIDYGTGYRFRSDLEPDGLLNLADVGTFALHLGEACP